MYDNSRVQWLPVVHHWLKAQVLFRRLKSLKRTLAISPEIYVGTEQGWKKYSRFLLSVAALGLSLPVSLSIHEAALAQVPRLNVPSAQNLPTDLPPPRDVVPPTSPSGQPELIPSPPPTLEQLLPNQFPQQPQEKLPSVDPDTYEFNVTKFEFEGGTVFDDEKLLRAMEVFLEKRQQESEQVTELLSNQPTEVKPSEEAGLFFDKDICKQLLDRIDQKSPPQRLPRTEEDPQIKLSFAQLLEARSAITNLYICKGYITSGAVIPEQKLAPGGGVVTIKLVEGRLEDIKVTGTRRLNRSYIRNRLKRADRTPLNRDRLRETLQLLQENPRVESFFAELAAGSRFGTNILQVKIKEANTIKGAIALDNNRSPSVGSFQRSVELREENLSGIGDTIKLSYANTDGSDQIDLSYILPLSPRDTELYFTYGFTSNNIIEEPFNELDIVSDSDKYELSLRHPLIKTPNKELALGLTFSHQRTQTFLGKNDIGGFPLSPGADEEGRTRVSALRFSQEWTQRDTSSVFALRSQFNLGVNIFDATINDDAPDSEFFSWRAQAQWVKQLAPETLLVLRGGVQLADRRLVSLEKFGVGGAASVRGYRQDQLLRDNGAFGSVELRYPILRIPEWEGVLQIAPFFDIGTASNFFENEDRAPATLVSTGLGLQFKMRDLNARLDWGIPLVSIDEDDENENENSLQEQGIYFSLQWNAF